MTTMPIDPAAMASPEDMALQVRALGSDFNAEVLAATRAIYRPRVDLAEAAVEAVDVAYGPHERHRLDVYRPGGACEAIVVFVHGGGFVAGDKNGDGVFYRNIGRWLARQGMAAVLPNYRLAPADPWPAGARDLQSVLQWLGRSAATFGASPGQVPPVILWGQSAGASHVASWLFDDTARGGPAIEVAGVMLMSGFFCVEAPLPPGPHAYFGEDAALYAQRAPIAHVGPLAAPLWLGVAELDPGWIAHQTYALAQAVTRANGRSPDVAFFRGHNHVSTVQSMGSPQHDVAAEVLRFIRDLDVVMAGRNCLDGG
ncbi:alpha/beta hydrolase [Variovorax boronicumulans]|uniref:alpha/beta hydrolase n=1 Tax=Variovorax boronicumulans TaxID=436515 RepID=UPI001C5731BE